MGKITLENVKDSSFYCSGRLSVGVFKAGDKVVLIDTAIDDQSAGYIDKAIKDDKCTVSAIINTHSHADHCGGNNYFQKKYPNVQIYSGKYEKHYIEDTANEPRCFCGGAAPIKELRNKFLEAKCSRVTNTIEIYEDQDIKIEGLPFKIITLPGHTPGMIGVITPDNILYCGDAIFGAETFVKHGVLFYTDIPKTLETFEKLANLNIDGCVFYHGGYIQDIKPVVVAHKLKIQETATVIEDLIKLQCYSYSELTKSVMRAFDVPENVVQFTLTESCVKAYVQYLQAQGKVELHMKDGLLVIQHAAVNVSPANPVRITTC